jgi:hypothetical protein
MKHRPKYKFDKLSQSLYTEMSAGGWAQQEQPDLFAKMTTGDILTYEEAVEARDGLDTTVIACEAILGGGGLTFEDCQPVNAAKRSAEARIKKLDAYLKSNK